MVDGSQDCVLPVKRECNCVRGGARWFCCWISYLHISALSRKRLSMARKHCPWKRWQVLQGLKIKIFKPLGFHMEMVNDIMLEASLRKKILWGMLGSVLDQAQGLELPAGSERSRHTPGMTVMLQRRSMAKNLKHRLW